MKNIDKAYLQIDPLLKSSREVKDSLSELKLLDRKCRYFYSKNKIDSLLKASENLEVKAIEYKDLYSVSMGNVYMAEAYSINQFYDKALYHLDIAYKTLEKDKSKNSKIFFAKANVLNSFANVYADKGEPRKAVKKLYQVIDSYNELDDPKQIKSFQYLNYSNIASLYLNYNIDSANYFAGKSVQLGTSENIDDKVMITNYQVFGKVNKVKKDYKKSLLYYHKALELTIKVGDQLNVNNLYKDIAELYKLTGKKDSAIIYENKLKQNEISELQSKYNSLHEVIAKDKKEDGKSETLNNIVLTVVITISVGLLIWSFVLIRKKRASKEEPHETYNKLLSLLKENDPSFMFAFENAYPDFSEKLRNINSGLSNSEIEFCAYLKLKLSTKEIAKITFIEPRTVQNKKHRIRKRLDIPSNSDIYNWFETI
ncbi:helix-turn-helix transcriptional regulator [Chryseobacterium sp. FH1]|uniref:helix-turn-helix transcriptional regulator n=1 Tax=Chryseobacterium sp. FH1 TaxID=1233951 RepID=UPI000B0CAD9E|nr:LuxR C-terminal-related transcriptional regulator [Chryseobacterium sp. FH1]